MRTLDQCRSTTSKRLLHLLSSNTSKETGSTETLTHLLFNLQQHLDLAESTLQSRNDFARIVSIDVPSNADANAAHLRQQLDCAVDRMRSAVNLADLPAAPLSSSSNAEDDDVSEIPAVATRAFDEASVEAGTVADVSATSRSLLSGVKEEKVAKVEAKGEARRKRTASQSVMGPPVPTPPARLPPNMTMMSPLGPSGHQQPPSHHTTPSHLPTPPGLHPSGGHHLGGGHQLPSAGHHVPPPYHPAAYMSAMNVGRLPPGATAGGYILPPGMMSMGTGGMGVGDAALMGLPLSMSGSSQMTSPGSSSQQAVGAGSAPPGAIYGATAYGFHPMYGRGGGGYMGASAPPMYMGWRGYWGRQHGGGGENSG